MSALILWIFNGGGFLPLFGALIVSSLILFLMLLFNSKNYRQMLLRGLKFIFTTLLISVLVHSYWLLPFVSYVKTNFSSSVAEAGGLAGVLNWLAAISKDTSFINMFRLQGIQEWYVNTQHPYARNYLNIFATAISFLIPTIFIFSLKFKNKKNNIIITSLILISLVSLFFMAGSHPPFGWLYVQLIKYVPGFIAFRTPYYKFAPGFYVGFAPLFAYVFSKVIFRSTKIKIPHRLKVISIALLVLLYNFPFFSVDFFQYTNDLSTKVAIPEYVLDYKDFANSAEFEYKRTLLLPGRILGTGVASYQWGYWSLAGVHSLLDNHSYVMPPTSDKSIYEKMLMDLYSGILDDKNEWLSIAQHVGVDSILLEKDFVDFDFEGKNISAVDFHQAIKNLTDIKLVKSFGEWSLYEIPQPDNFSNQYIELKINSETTQLSNYLFNNLDLNPSLVITDKSLPVEDNHRSGTIIFPECMDCFLSKGQQYFAGGRSILTPDSIFYKLLLPLSSLKKSLPPEINQDPISTLENLYAIQAQFSHKKPYSSRSPIWDAYLANLNFYKEDLIDFLNEVSESSISNLKIYGLYNNIVLQGNLLKDISSLINQEDEAKNYFKAREILKDMEELALKHVAVTPQSHQPLFTFDLDKEGEYSIDLFRDSTNYSLLGHQLINFVLNDVEQQINGRDGEWFSLGKHNLKEGLNTLRLIDYPLNKRVNFENSEYDISSNCSRISLGDLDRNRYQLSIGLINYVGDVDLTYHIQNTANRDPILPYWGLKQETKRGISTQMSIPFEASIVDEYVLRICDDVKQKQSPVRIESIVLDRIPKTEIVLSNLDEENSISSKKIDLEIIDNNRIEIEVPGGEEGFLSLPIVSTQNWENNRNLTTFKFNGNLLGYYLPASADSYTIKLDYKIQKHYLVGWLVAGFGLISSIVLYFILHKKRK